MIQFIIRALLGLLILGFAVSCAFGFYVLIEECIKGERGVFEVVMQVAVYTGLTIFFTRLYVAEIKQKD